MGPERKRPARRCKGSRHLYFSPAVFRALSAAYAGAGAGALVAARGVALGLTVWQAEAGFVIDSIVAPIDQFVQKVAAVATVFDQLYSALRNGYFYVVGASGQVSVQSGQSAQASVGVGAAIIGIYSTFRYPSTIYQPNRLNQYAAFKDDYTAAGYGYNDGLVLMLKGSIQQPGSEHYRFHQYLRDNLRKPALAANKQVTIAEYNRAVFAALSEIRGRNTARFALSLMVQEQKALGRGPLDVLKHIPLR
jgi:hypothetical protein